MRKNIPITVLITLFLLFIFACLPKIVSGFLDFRSGKIPSYKDILSVKLDISQDGQELSFADKLVLIRDAQAVNINQSQAAMTEEEVNTAVAVFLQNLERAGIYEQFSPTHISLQPKLMYDLSDSARHIVIWTVTMTNKKAPNQALMVDVDDQTGAILCVSYSIYRSYSMNDVWDRNKMVLDRFSELYFEQFGIVVPSNIAEQNSTYDVDREYREVDGGVSEAIYSFSDFGEEELTVKITVDGAGGFRITLFS